ncbi:RNA polymerase sigma factor [Viridibacillus sp. YIM B01967]|uniref:RNA polymerase sigma factor n=1 Tax=Viridibacillus soli TaxID=2798301 RepID=A0ABS1HCB6_9BACL|nr:RNA polymerase sigma factor [Viridibacillus soli]MBK3497059.1 RNA polymerase sigma factor [Viridibacillus soli]
MKDDYELIKEIKLGSKVAMEELVDKYYKQIFHYTYRILGSYEDAYDATQEVFIAMMKALPTYQEHGKFISWLYTIAHNRCMNNYNKLKKHKSELIEEQEMSATEDHSNQYANSVFAKELLDTLPKIQKSTLILKYYHDLTSKEIAKITGVTIFTVKSRLYQGLQKLRKTIKEREKNERKG